MTTTAPESPAADQSAPAVPGPPSPAAARARWRQRRPAVLAIGGSVGLLLLVILLTLLATGSSRGSDLDPRSADPTGTLALAQLLRARGVAVDRGAVARPGETLVVPFAGRFEEPEVTRLLSDSPSAARIVLLTPADVPAASLTEGHVQGVSRRQPGCSLAAAQVAGSAAVGGRTFTGGSTSCYDGSLVVGQRGTTPVLALGSPTFLTNEHLDEDGNAALALGLLSGTGVPGGPSGRVVWYQPALDPQADPPGFLDLLPPAVLWAVAQLALATIVIALWRGRRLGPVVEEPLPVIVPAAETVEGRARLYAAGRARQAAAEALRTGARARLGGMLQHGGEPDPTGLVVTVAERSGRQPGEVADLLYGSAGPSAPADDAALVRLADDIDRLEREVRAQ